MVDQVQVAKDAVEDKGQSQKQPLGVKLAHGFLAHCIQRIAHHGGGSDNTNHHIEKMGVILPQNLSVRFRFLSQKDKLVATLTKTQKKRKQRGAKQQPMAYLHLGGHGPPHYPKNKPPPQGQPAQDPLALPPRRTHNTKQTTTP